jgi:hypothetical protein
MPPDPHCPESFDKPGKLLLHASEISAARFIRSSKGSCERCCAPPRVNTPLRQANNQQGECRKRSGSTSRLRAMEKSPGASISRSGAAPALHSSPLFDPRRRRVENHCGTPFVPTPAGQHGRERGQRRAAGAELQERSDEASTHPLTA